MTIQDSLVKALEALGEVRVTGSQDQHQRTHIFSRKYITMTREQGGYYFIGKQGALRVGAIVSRSHNMPDSFKRRLLATVPAKQVKPTALPYDMS